MIDPVTQTYSSFGVDNTTTGPGFRARSIITSERFRDLDRRQQYYDCTQHDFKKFDFDGRMLQPGPPTSQPMLSSEKSSWYVPLRMRRPSSPYRLARIIITAFTSMVFGERRWPTIRIDADEDAQDFAQALVKASNLPIKMIQARNYGGAQGSVGLSWAFKDGKPRVSVHQAKHLYVHEWEDQEELIPAYVIEMYRYPKDEWDYEKQKMVRNWYWYRRDWTKDSDILFLPVRFKNDSDPTWAIDQTQSFQHDDGFCHFVWIQNLPSEEPDGVPDYHGLYETFDSIDLLNSVLTRGTTLNLDPTLKLKMDPDLINRMGVSKGSDNALIVGESGDASYMELAGTSVTAGLSLFDMKRRTALEVTQCIVPDPSEIATSGTSSVAMKVIYAPMLSKCDVLRDQYGEAVRRLLTQMLEVSRKRLNEKVTIRNAAGEDVAVKAFIALPVRITRDMNPETGEETKTISERTPGIGGEIELEWGDYFMPTPDDQAKVSQTLATASGGKAFMAHQTATEIAASFFNRDPAEEWRRVQADKETQAAQQASMFADVGGYLGGQVDERTALPPGAVARQAPIEAPEQEAEGQEASDEGEGV